MRNGVKRWAPVALAGVLAGLVAGAGTARADLIYATNGQNGNPGNLYTIDPTTLAITTVGPVSFAVTGLALDPVTGVLYGDTAPRGTNTRQLITINPATGAGTLVGALGVGLDGIAFDSGGNLYGWSGRTSGSDLYRVNIATGAATKVGEAGITDTGAALAFSPTQTLYLAAAGASGVLRTVDKTSGVVFAGPTLTGAPFPTGSIKALTFNSAGTLYGINLNDGGPGTPGAPSLADVVTINPTTGAVTTLGPGPAGLTALAFSPAAVPEPSTVTMVTLAGTLGLACWWRRRRAV